MQTRRRLTESLLAEGITNRRSLEAQTELTKIAARRPVEAYFRAVEKERGEPNALEAKLFRAGFYQTSAPLIYTLSRIAFVARRLSRSLSRCCRAVLPPQLPGFIAFAGAVILGLACIVIPSIALDRFENAEKQKYRRGFPDFMDMMITCADAGMSLEAAVERVSSELAGTHKALGIQLAIMTLQMRAGKPLRDALRDLCRPHRHRGGAVARRAVPAVGGARHQPDRGASRLQRRDAHATHPAGGGKGERPAGQDDDTARPLYFPGRDDDRHVACDYPDEGRFLLDSRELIMLWNGWGSGDVPVDSNE